jgi:hypothetical protein
LNVFRKSAKKIPVSLKSAKKKKKKRGALYERGKEKL